MPRVDGALKGKSLTAAQIEMRVDRYQYPVACGLWLQSYFVSQTADGQRPSEPYQRAELRRLADAVLVAVDPDVDLAKEEGDLAA